MQNRRDWLLAAGGGTLIGLLSTSERAVAQETAKPNNPFILLLKGIYRPVASGPDLGLSAVNLNDGSYARTRIFPVFGISSDDDAEHEQKQKPIGDFYTQSGNPGALCAYDLPGGTIAMQFISGGFTPHPDGAGGNFLEGTFELKILEATGVFRAFEGGHNHMVDRLHQLANSRLDEFCFCVISQYQFP
jgi:hypothetical protein